MRCPSACSEAAGRSGTKTGSGVNADTDVNNAQALAFVYPYGATLNVARPAVPVLSSGSVSFPLNRPVCALYSHGERGGGGRLAVVGSGTMFSDQGLEWSPPIGLTI